MILDAGYLRRPPVMITARSTGSEVMLKRADKAKARVSGSEFVHAILRLRERPENWDGYGSAAPTPEAISRAVALADVIKQRCIDASRSSWRTPFVGSTETGEVSFEWWSGQRKLTIFVGAETSSYLKSWGLDLESEMEDGPLLEDSILELWEWLHL